MRLIGRGGSESPLLVRSINTPAFPSRPATASPSIFHPLPTVEIARRPGAPGVIDLIVHTKSCRLPPGRVPPDGFTLVICLVLMTMLVVVALGLMTLASIELRKSTLEDPAALAKANARLALMQAIGQLQKTMGPDQRISAPADLLRTTVRQPCWTGAWRTTLENGDPLLTRDDLTGGLRDARWEKKLDPATQVMEWLVSGSGDPTKPTTADMVALVYQDNLALVEVPKVPVAKKTGGTSGNCAWWTGDLGVRANLATGDPRSKITADRKSPSDGGLYRVMASQAADMSLMEGNVTLNDSQTQRLTSGGELAFTAAGKDWTRKHVLDFTTQSYGVLADVVNGGLKRDLTAYFQGGGNVPDFKNLKGLADGDPLVGPAADAGESVKDSRYQAGGPRFGLLRDWARSSVAFATPEVPAKLPEADPAAASSSKSRSLANEQPVKLAGNQRAGLQPILVEATNFTQMSTYLDKTAYVNIYQLRQFMYPRVVLWNPYNVKLKFDRALIMIQGNGRQEMWTKNANANNLPPWEFQEQTEWINFEGGRSTSFGSWPFLFNSEGYNDPYMGSYYFAIPETIFEPGECLVFSPPRSAEYDGLSVYRPGSYNLNNNELSCTVAPDPSRSYYVSASDIDGGMDFLPTEFWYAPTNSVYVNGKFGVANQSDDTRAILKQVGKSNTITFEAFDALPQISVLSASLQYGAGREPRIAWSKYEHMPMQLVDKTNPKPTVIPNVRTREGIRLRWFDEHPSNQINSGSLTGTAHFEDALLADWNPRASFIVRSPWENIAGDVKGGPWFFGAYTRDLYDQAVSWDDQVPVPRNGRYHGNPFGPPQEGVERYVLFDVPRNETGLVSLGQLQHVKLSELVWHPSYPIGNSLADPRLGTGGNKGLHRTSPVLDKTDSAKLGGFYESEIGWSNDTVRSSGKGDWASAGRSILGELPARDNVVYDLSFEANRSLWDRYYLSSGSADEKRKFLADPLNAPLPNGRLCLAPATRATATEASLSDFHQSAYQLMVGGAFNVNSTRVEAWKALLGSTRRSGYGSSGNIPFPRVIDSPGKPWHDGDPITGDGVWAGYRELTVDEVGRLAQTIVDQVKLRGPFLSLSDFVNRRLAEDETGRTGALQAAIDKANLNSGLAASFPLNNRNSLPNYKHPDNIADATRLEQTLKPASKAWGAASYLTQADVLQVLGPALAARSDSFVIRAYGDAVDVSGKVLARAYCEAVVQRTPQPLVPDDSGLNPKLSGKPGDFGRRFVMSSFRWLVPGEI